MSRIKHVQAHINNISFPKTLDELYWFVTENGFFNVEDILFNKFVEWTVPNWTQTGDIVFFMHAKTARSTITKLRTELKKLEYIYTDDKRKLLQSWLERGLTLHKKFGGKIYAIGIVTGKPKHDTFGEEYVHWHSRIYAEIRIACILERPIDISEFNDFITVSRQSGITPVLGNDFTKLISLISNKNILPNEIKNCDATPLPVSKITDDNWLSISDEYRRSFILESQFRHFYVDYLLKSIGDQKQIFRECRCIKANVPDSFVDNIILIKGRYLPVEVKLSISTQRDLKGQVAQYCCDDKIILDSKNKRAIYPKQLYNNTVLIIDTGAMYIYSNIFNTINILCFLQDLKTFDNLKEIREKIICMLK